MNGDYVIETRHGEIRYIPHNMIGYMNIEDHIIGILVEGDKVRMGNPFNTAIPLFIVPDKFEEYYFDAPLKDIESQNEYYYGWKSIKSLRHKIAEFILGRKILVSRRK